MVQRTDQSRSDEETRLHARIEALREELAAASVELEELRTELTAFEIRFDARIGVLIVELDRINMQIEEYERRLAGLDRPVDEWPTVEEEIREAFRSTRERIDQEDEEARGAGQRERELPPEPPVQVKEELKKLYRRLALDFHPDTAQDAEQRTYNEQAMRRINDAFERRDYDALARLESELSSRQRWVEGDTLGERIAKAAAIIATIERSIADVRASIVRIRATEKHRLMESVRVDPTRLDRLERAYADDIDAGNCRLASLVDTYRESVSVRLSASAGAHE